MRYSELTESQTHTWSYDELLAKFGYAIASDLIDFAAWFKADSTQLKYNLEYCPMSKFIEEAKELYATYPQFPNDAKRTQKIIKALRAGAQQLPVFIDSEGFICEGRHRIVAFMLLGLQSVPCVTIVN